VGIQKLMAAGTRKSALSKLQNGKFAKSSPAIIFNIANLQSEEGELEKAISNYQQAIKLMPSFRRAHQNLAFAFARKGELKDAYNHLLEVVRLGGNSGSVMGLLGNCYQEQERFQAALLSFRKAQLTQPDTTEWKLGVAFCLQKLDRIEEALTQYDEVEKLLPDSADIKFQQVSLLVSLGRSDEAIVKLELLRRMEKLDAQNELWLGTLHLGQRNIVLGAQTLKRVIKDGKIEVFAPVINAIKFSLDVNQDELARELVSIVQRDKLEDSDKTKLTRLEAEIYLRDDETSSQGVELLEKLIAEDPTDVYSQYILASHLVEVGKNLEAIVRLEQALIIESDYKLQLYVELAQAQVALKQFKEALPPLKSYLDLKEDENIREYYEAILKLVNSQK